MSTSSCVKWSGEHLPLNASKIFRWVEFININKDWYYTKRHYTDGTHDDEGPFRSFSFPTPRDMTMDCYKNPDGWINKEVLFSFSNPDGSVNREVVRLYYPDGTTMDGVEFHNVIDGEQPEGAVEMPAQDISAMFEEKVKQLNKT